VRELGGCGTFGIRFPTVGPIRRYIELYFTFVQNLEPLLQLLVRPTFLPPRLEQMPVRLSTALTCAVDFYTTDNTAASREEFSVIF
jgi:hypothetical protein